MQRVRGLIDLIFDVVDETTNLVERTHDAVVDRSVRRFAPVEPLESSAKLVTGIQTAISATVFNSIRGINGVSRSCVNAIADVAEDQFDQAALSKLELTTPLQSTALGSASWCVDYLQSSLNGFWGDYMAEHNPRLDSGMTLRHHGRSLAATPEALAAAYGKGSKKICIFVHGLASTEWLWSLASEHYYDGKTGVTFGTRLQEDLDFTPVYLRYNTGLHISENGRELTALITELVNSLPETVEEIALVGHSMGGLVARSAANYAREQAEPWVDRLRHVACIGTPHLGAPLEKAVNLLTSALRHIDAAGADVPAELLDARSAGVKDLRYGYTVDEEWFGKDADEVFADARRNVPLVDGVGYYFFAATISKDPAHPLGQLLGDLLVRLPSASGEAQEATRHIPFTSGRVFPGMNHIHIISHPDIYESLRDQLAN